MSEQEVIKIVIEKEDVPLKADTSKSGTKTAASDASRRIAVLAKEAAQRAANSEAGRKAAGKMQEAADRGVRYVGTRMADTAEDQAKQTMEAMQERIKQTDWEKEAKGGLSLGLQWASERIGELSDRFTTAEPQEKDQ